MEKLKKESPELFVKEKASQKELFRRLGITIDFPKLPKGYVRFTPLDFIVEEILKDKTIVLVDGETMLPENLGGKGTIYADLIKVGISTIDAAERLAEALRIEAKRVGYAGIKDAVAITAQRISMRGADLFEVKDLSIPNVFLKSISEGKGVMQVGDLYGNRFTLFIRTEPSFDKKAFEEQVEKVRTAGIINFYGPQRFGSPRFLSHMFGMYLARGDFKRCIEIYIAKESPFESPYAAKIRKKASEKLGDWDFMYDEMGKLPYAFRHERVFLDVLKTRTGKDVYKKAIEALPRQVDLWARAYASYLANLALSGASRGESEIPENLPLLLSLNEGVREFYQDWLEQHGTKNYLDNLGALRFIHIGEESSILSRIYPEIHKIKIVPEGVGVCFDLTKGAYATTVLTFLFDVVTGEPIPEWVMPKEYDVKELLGMGSIAGIREEIDPYLRGV